MSQALYRTYRPQTFADLIGQNPIRVTLENEIEHNRIAHAYLFSGPRGVGKTTTARLLAKAVNCVNRKGAEPCNTCDFCKEIANGRSLDLIEIDAASHTGVDNVRENIIENARFTPQRAKYKVFIIDEVHMLSVSAFNALLKTLEEPPEHVIFILATTELHRLPETIISRCQRFDFKRVGLDDMVKRLESLIKSEKIKVDDVILQTIAKRAEGSVRDAEVLLAQIMALGEKHITEKTASVVIPRSNVEMIVELFRRLMHNEAPAALITINKLIDEGVNLASFTKDLVEFLRTLLLLKVTGTIDTTSSLVIDQKIARDLHKELEFVSVGRLIRMIEVFSQKMRELRYASIAQLPLELGVLELTLVTDRTMAEEKTQQVPPAARHKIVGTDASDLPGGQDSSIKKSALDPLHFELIKDKWGALLKEIQKLNHSLGVSLKLGCPLAIQDSSLNIGFRYQFHADRFNDRKVRAIIEDAAEKVFGRKLSFRTSLISQEEFEQLTNSTPPSQAEETGTVENILNTFGGEVVAED